jgi:hypothetical protein
MRAAMVPTLNRVLGVKGHRPQVGTWDNKDLLHVFGSVNAVDGRLHTSTLLSQAKMLRDQRLAGNRQQVSKTRRMTEAFAEHLQAVAAAYPADQHKQVVLVIDNAPWHRGPLVREVLEEHLRLHRLPPYSPKLNVIERLWTSACDAQPAVREPERVEVRRGRRGALPATRPRACVTLDRPLAGVGRAGSDSIKRRVNEVLRRTSRPPRKASEDQGHRML